MRKGQGVMSLPFVFIIAIIIAAIVVIFAVRTIGNLNCNQEQIKINLFVADLKKDIEKAFYASAGSQMVFTGELPPSGGGCARIEQVCIVGVDVDGDKRGKEIGSIVSLELYEEIKNQLDVEKQLLFYPRDNLHKASVAETYNIRPKEIQANVEEDTNPICFINNGRIEITLKNAGDHIEILQ